MSAESQNSEEPVWIFLDVDSRVRPMADYDDELSSMSSADTVTTEPFPVTETAVFVLDDAKTTDISSYDLLSNTNSSLLMRRKALALFKALGPDAVSTKPVDVRTLDGVIKDFELVKPLISVDCIDLEASELTWLSQKHRYIGKIKKLRFKPHCMQGYQFCRESISKHLIISDELRIALDEIDRDGYIPARPEDVKR